MRQRDEPEIAAARCSDTQDFAVPGTPSSSSARSVASVATAVSISRRLPTYFGVIAVPSAALPPDEVGHHRLRRQLPVGRPLPFVGLGESRELVGEDILGRLAQHGGHERFSLETELKIRRIR